MSNSNNTDNICNMIINLYKPTVLPTENGKMLDNNKQYILAGRKINRCAFHSWINVGAINWPVKTVHSYIKKNLPAEHWAYGYELLIANDVPIPRLRCMFITEDGYRDLVQINNEISIKEQSDDEEKTL